MAVLNNRNFIGIELDEVYFNIAKQRIDEAIKGGAND
jgi:DNA modification methylase